MPYKDKARNAAATKAWREANKARDAANQKAWHEANKDTKEALRKTRYKERLANGICTGGCGGAAKPGYALCEPCFEKKRERTNRTNKKLKVEVMEHYGSICICCGEQRLECLSIDHINGGGNAHREELKIRGGSTLYRWLRKNNWPKGYQVLCLFCNKCKGAKEKCGCGLDRRANAAETDVLEHYVVDTYLRRKKAMNSDTANALYELAIARDALTDVLEWYLQGLQPQHRYRLQKLAETLEKLIHDMEKEDTHE